jgi:hypothetical protein
LSKKSGASGERAGVPTIQKMFSAQLSREKSLRKNCRKIGKIQKSWLTIRVKFRYSRISSAFVRKGTNAKMLLFTNFFAEPATCIETEFDIDIQNPSAAATQWPLGQAFCMVISNSTARNGWRRGAQTQITAA